MRGFISILLFTLGIGFTVNARSYYVSNSGNDSNNGLTPSTAWKTLNKVSSFTLLLAGDSLLFNRGEIFYGQLVMNRAGASGNPIVFGAYGTGPNPVITGLTTVTSWTFLGNNVWESTDAISTLKSCNMVVINGVNTPMGRYPNTGYLTYQSFTSNTITSTSAASSVTNWTGAVAAIKKNNWVIDRDTITAHSGNVLTHTVHSIYNGINNYGFFLENDPRTLDTANEWYYNSSTKKIRVYSADIPSNVQVATVDSLVKMSSKFDITFTDISFIGSNTATISITNTRHVKILNCNLDFAGVNAIITRGGGGDSTKVVNCVINHSNNNAIDLGGASPNCLISNVAVRNTGMIAGMGAGSDGTYTAIQTNSDNGIVENCIVDSTGYVGIVFYGNNTIVRNNLVSNFCLTKFDGGGIYTFVGIGSTPYSGEKVLNNIVLGGFASTAGTIQTVPLMHGIYMDEGTGNVEIAGNTIAGCQYSGLYIHNAHDLNIHHNTCYNNGLYQTLFGSFNAGGPIRNVTMKNNIFVARAAAQFAASFQSAANDISSFGVIDSNYYARPIDDNVDFYVTINNKATIFNYTFFQWQAYAGFDTHSHNAPKIITSLNDLRFDYNATGVIKPVSLDATYIDMKNVSYNGGLNLSPYASTVIIKNGLANNQLPAANAGNDQKISLPLNTISLSGSGTDPDGTIATYSWTKISGPVSYTITNPDSASTSVTGLSPGVYSFELKVTDNNAGTAKDTVQVSVNAPPTANAGPNKTIKLPVSTVTLDGSGSDPDGPSVTYAWSKVAGSPAGGVITTPTAASTGVSGLIQGTYQFKLDVTDLDGATTSSTVQVTVSAENIPPIADAGNAQVIKLPISTTTLNGSGSDPDGTGVTYAWSKVAGSPAGGIITTPTAASTGVSGLIQGTYQFKLDVTDLDGATTSATVQVTVSAENIPPIADAGTNQTIKLPVSTTTLNGSGSDPDGASVTFAWSKVAGSPAGGIITTPTAASTGVSGLIQGTYQFKLDVTDLDGATTSSTVQVTVSAENIPPTADAGTNQTIKLPVSTTTLNGSGSDPDGASVTFAWSKVAGSPAGGIITTPTAASTGVSGLIQGTYQFKLDVTDLDGATTSSTVQVTVSAENIPPIADAGNAQVIKLPISTTTLNGSGSDPDGTGVTYAWSKVAGSPAGGIITTPTAASTGVNGLIQGTYQFKLDVTDLDGATTSSTVQVTVSAENIPPIADAGTNQTIKLPVSTTTLNGSGSDPDGTGVTYAWSKVAGSPAGGIITTPTAASTGVSGLIQGTYQFKLDVTDLDGAITSSTVQVTVSAENILPIADAGTNQTIKLPVSTTTLNGSGSDPDGASVTFAWSKVTGSPAGGIITTPTAASTGISGLIQGTYQFKLDVTDLDGATTSATVQVTVSAENIPPIADAGNAQVIKLPVSTTTLNGSGSDPDGASVTFAWSKVAGSPAGGIITTPTAASTGVSGLIQGTYQFKLDVTDLDGATTSATVQVTVSAENIPPIADAGNAQIIKLPISSTTLNGSGSDPDGASVTFAWSKVAGSPAGGIITTPTAASTGVSGLIQGTYQFKLDVTDLDGATTSSTVQVTVSAENIPPIADAGTNQTIKLPVSTTTLNGSGSDPDGASVTFAWSKVAGSPAGGIITTPTAASTGVSGLIQGTYQFKLDVTDLDGATTSATVQVTVSAENIPPIADAGTNQTIKLPVSTTTLNGSGSDPDGASVTFAWSKVAGSPAGGIITTPTAASTGVSGLIQGTYQFKLDVTDLDGATTSSTVQVTVSAENIPPIADAGNAQVIKLPINSTTLNGSGSDPDGASVTFAWSKVAGSPAGGIITTPTAASTGVSGLIQGTYQFKLDVTDLDGATTSSTVQVTVSAENIPPTADAGTNQTIKLPISTTTLNGSGSDPDGPSVTYAWSKVAGSPAGGVITTPTAASTGVSGLIQGTYQFKLDVTDLDGATTSSTVQVTVSAENIPPIADAGNAQVIKLPINSTTLNGSGSDPDGASVTFAWSKVAGSPAGGIITTPTAASTGVSGLIQGTYQFKLDVTDLDGATTSSTVQVTVSAENIPPIADAGTNQTIKLPVSTTTLNGSGSDPDGASVTFAWSKVAGSPAGGIITTPTAASTGVSGLIQGTYQFKLDVTDLDGATTSATVQVTVSALNIPPIASAGTNQTIKLPVSSTTLNGSGSDPDGASVTFAWSKVAGSPAGGIITTPAAASTGVSGLIQGTYQFKLDVTDLDGATTSATVQVTVSALNIPPIASAGTNQTIKLPVSTTTLNGSGSDPDGASVTFAWSKVAGSPAGGIITTPAAASTGVSGLIQGTYQFKLDVTDLDGATTSSTVQVTVSAENIPPIADAGTNQTIKLPVSTTTLNGSGSDPDGASVTFAWSKVAGSPAGGIITTPTAASTGVSGLIQGTYQFKLDVTDLDGATTSSTVQVTVSALNIPPIASAGNPQTIKLPVSTTTLNGSGSDPDGTGVTFAWSKVAGSPAGGIITTPTAASTGVNGLIQGTYQFKLDVTDLDGATTSSTVQVTVSTENIPPISDAGNAQVIKLPISITTLNGSGSDPDGASVTFAWSKVTGSPAGGIITTPTAASTGISGLIQGTYQFKLDVTDLDGATTSATVQVTVSALNIPPISDAGNAQVIKLPISTTTLNGSGSDPDGTGVTYAWSKVAGSPAGGIITTPTAASTGVSGLIQGTYQFKLDVTDLDGATTSSTVQVTVSAENIPPIADAGTNQTIKLPISTTTLNGSGSDPDGTGVTYAWSKVAGSPAGGIITTPTAASTGVSGLIQGTYQFKLDVTDLDGATTSSTVQVTVSAENIPPIADAGTNQTIKLPVSTTTLNGSGSDPDGASVTFAWSKVAGSPAGGIITTPTAASTGISGLIQGTYQFKLDVTDLDGATTSSTVQVTVSAENIPPIADAGTNQTIKLPVSTTTLNGSGSDPDGASVTFAWSKVAGSPAGGIITTPTAASTGISGLIQGTYQFKLDVTDLDGATTSSTVQVTVSALNIPPIASAGNPQTIKLPVSTTTLNGSGSDPDGASVTFAWSKVAGSPAGGIITTPTAASTGVSGLIQGTYQFKLDVTDLDGATTSSTVQVTVNALNIPPIASAGNPQTIKLPVSTTTLNGSGSDPDGASVTFAWSKVAGSPAGGIITTPTAASTGVSGLIQGTYQFKLDVTDLDGATTSSTVQVTVSALNIPPIASAGNPQTIKLPVSTTTLNGSGSDPDGASVTFAWSKVAGSPAGGIITTPTAASTGVSGLIQGTYQFKLDVTDLDGATTSSTVQVTVSALNIPPIASAGNPQTIKLPVSTTTLNGSGSDPDGASVTFAWSKVAGSPAGGIITTPTAASTGVSGLIQGTYQFKLDVTDLDGATTSSTVQVTVSALNIPPIASAGNPQTIKLPVSTTTLNGSGSDPDGASVTFAWSKVAGSPAGGIITTPTAASTGVSGLIQGTYQFKLDVTDLDGATTSATVQVTVNALNIPPIADAGTNQTIKLPVSTTTLNGSGSDPDGASVTFAWSKVAGSPAGGIITTPTAASTGVSGLIQGTYQFKLDVTDLDGATTSSTVQVTVNALNIAPIASAGNPQTIKLPVSTTTLNGSGSDPDGASVTFAWSKVAGSPAGGIITTPAAASTGVSGLIQGTYQFKLDVTDLDGATTSATVQVTVSALNIPPIASAGTNQTIKLPVSTTTLNGSGSDPDGTGVTYAWSKVAGSPAGGIITTPAAASTGVSGLIQGTYQFKLDVTDLDGATTSSTVQVTVSALNIPPIASAGTNQTIKLPVSSTTLNGSGSDPDGASVTFAWSKVAGSPAGGIITTPAAASTGVSGLIQGTYQFKLDVTDLDGATTSATVQVTVSALNIPPIASAGTNQTIKLPVSTTTLNGSGSDPDGTGVTYAWSKVAGSPAGGIITTPAAASTGISGLIQGTYQFKLDVTDLDGATTSSTVQVTVSALNIPPIASAGNPQTIKLPVSTTTLNGSGSDPDGASVTFAWSKVAGSPAGGIITTPTAASTGISGLIQGTYQFKLDVTDLDGATTSSTVQVIVNAINILPIANAGIDQLITLPVNSVSLSGSGTDADGSITAYNWTKIAGPAAGTITNSTSAITSVTGLTQGIYQFELKVTDNDLATRKDTLVVTVNVAPIANAGVDQVITLPTSTTTLSGSGTDTDGSISAYNWTKLSGSPSGGTITSANSASTTITGLIAGIYKFQLKVTDNKAATGLDTVQITVAANLAPKANAGIDQVITLPTSTTTLSGSGTDTDGSISAYNWTKLSGSPSGGTITSANSASTTITGLIAGVYKFQLKVTDNKSATGLDTVQITVAANLAPKANAGVDQVITLPTSTTTLSGSGTDTDGSISAYNWTKLSGSPSGGTITSANSASTTITGLIAGIYKFQLKVTDNKAATGLDTVQITVAANLAPKANAGVDQVITLPTSTTTLSGSGTDTDGSISAYNWTKLSGSPSGGTITSANSASTTITGLIAGIYKFQLKVTDNKSATGLDTVQITVAANLAPKANAGVDQVITLPTSTTTLSGSGTDTDGSISAYNWTKLSGSPSGGTITSANSASTTITGLIAGVYKFQLKVTDNKSATGLDTVQITVAANLAPKANAGVDQVITLPTSTTTLSGSGTDTDGSISAYNWTKLSGSPSGGTITSANSASTTITGLIAGIYKFQLKVTDNKAATGLDTVQITVAANLAPKANAGVDQVITLPTSTTTLSGSGTDTDGSISAYNWTKLSGSPSGGTITSANSASTTITGLIAGIYKFQLKVTDNKSATGLDTVQITVAANLAPKANAGVDQVITLPTSTTTLSGSGTDTDGSISAYNWTKLSGSPSGGTITSANSASTTITGLIAGVYKFQLKVTDNKAATGLDTVQITVAANLAPKANAGVDQAVKLPTRTATLSGNGTDADGTVATYRWTKISGTQSTITSPTAKATTVTGLQQGTYKYQLTVTDNKGATGKDTMQVTVSSALSADGLAFKGQAEGDKVDLIWQAPDETNVSEFEVEKNTANTWEKMGSVSSAVNSSMDNRHSLSDNLPANGLNYYRLKVIDSLGQFVYSRVINVEFKARKNTIHQNVPNPFSSITTIPYEVADKALVKIVVYNTEGFQIAVLVNEVRLPGSYQVQWNATNIPSGNYYYMLVIGNTITTRKMLKLN